jgi:putative colanic acid biosynthesis acetyltransferase WcaF
MSDLDIIADRRSPNGPTFSLKNRILRSMWQVLWTLGARWTPPPFHLWRVLMLKSFGARVSLSAHVYASVDVWAPWNLEIHPYGSLGRGVRCYNIAKVSIGYKATVSQGAYLCTGSHNYRDPAFPLIAKPLSIGARAWICADAFVGPGVNVGEGAVLAAAGVAFRDLDKWTVYSGNPAVARRARPPIDDVVARSITN